MVFRKNLNKKIALISVYNKNNLKYLCSNLKKHNYSFMSTNSTCLSIRSMGFDCLNISKLIKSKEILDGRVKTINKKIFGSILFNRNNKKQIDEFKKLAFPVIELVVINLYPFNKFINKDDLNKSIEMIDIGGPSLLRAASKNFNSVTPISSIKNYKKLISNLNKNKGETDIKFRRKMASETFKLTSEYDYSIYSWIKDKQLVDNSHLRYGENPNQKSYLKNNSSKSIFDYQISGKKISYNNILDVDSGLKCLKEFNEPTCVIIKHTNPCGVASWKNIEGAFRRALSSDLTSSFGGIVLLNKKVDNKLARLINNCFFEIIVAPDFNISSIEILKQKKNLILLKIKSLKTHKMDIKSTLFGEIYQNYNNQKISKNFIKLVTKKKVSNKIIEDIIFSLKVVKHLKSNSIVLAHNKQTVGIGAGQTNRINALKMALKNKNQVFNKKNFVCSSDGFFPFTDGIKLLKKNSCICLSQPFGSINDEKIINYCNTNNLPLYKAKYRLFKH